MKKFIIPVLVAGALFCASCDKYDDSEIRDLVDNLEEKVEGLEAKVNSNVVTIKKLSDALSTGLTIVSVSENADKNGYEYFTTVMTISRQKNSQVLNQIGQKLQKKYSCTTYFFSDFKKNRGIDTARDMRIHYNLYQQLYCGCKYTYEKGIKLAQEKSQPIKQQ